VVANVSTTGREEDAMKIAIVVAALIAATAMPATLAAQTAPPAAGTVLGTVNLPTRVLANGQPLAAGEYQVRLTGDSPPPVTGQSPEGARFVEFVRGGKVAGREIATVITNAEIAPLVDGPKPAAGGNRVEVLKGAEYLRVWINRGGTNYLIHLTPSKT
jgi:hypothetical protein